MKGQSGWWRRHPGYVIGLSTVESDFQAVRIRHQVDRILHRAIQVQGYPRGAFFHIAHANVGEEAILPAEFLGEHAGRNRHVFEVKIEPFGGDEVGKFVLDRAAQINGHVGDVGARPVADSSDRNRLLASLGGGFRSWRFVFESGFLTRGNAPRQAEKGQQQGGNNERLSERKWKRRPQILRGPTG